MTGIHSLSDSRLVSVLPALVRAERQASSVVIEHLLEVDRRRLYLRQACSSLYKYCRERLGYSEHEALKRARVTRLAARVPRALVELREHTVHLTGLFVLAPFVTEENADELFDEARGKSRREIERLLARRFPRTETPPPGRIVPLSASSFRVEFTASRELCAKIERARELLSHVNPSGNLAHLFERALDGLIANELKQRIGVERAPKQHRAARCAKMAGAGVKAIPPNEPCLEQASEEPPIAEAPVAKAPAVEARPRVAEAPACDAPAAEAPTRVTYAPAAEAPTPAAGDARAVEASATQRMRRRPSRNVARVVWERADWQCSYVDAHGCRCSERCFLTIEHRRAFARGGDSSSENLSILCAAHNAMSARQVFGARHIEQKQLEARLLSALCGLGFRRPDCARVIAELRRGDDVDVDVDLSVDVSAREESAFDCNGRHDGVESKDNREGKGRDNSEGKGYSERDDDGRGVRRTEARLLRAALKRLTA